MEQPEPEENEDTKVEAEVTEIEDIEALKQALAKEKESRSQSGRLAKSSG